jgi:hypothetical protein
MSAFLVSAEESETLRRRAMRFSYHMPSVDVDEAVRLIFRADAEAGGQFTSMQYDALLAITDKAARQARETRETKEVCHAGT